MAARQLRPRVPKQKPLTKTLTASKPTAANGIAVKRKKKEIGCPPAETSRETGTDNAVSNAEQSALITLRSEHPSVESAVAGDDQNNQQVPDTSSNTFATKTPPDTGDHSSDSSGLSSPPPENVIASRTVSGLTPVNNPLNSTDDNECEPPTPKRRRRAAKSQNITDSADKLQLPAGRKKREKFLAKLGHTPWPDFERPFPQECYEVNERLTKAHGPSKRPEKLMNDTEVSGCGEVPHVLDALLRTYLSSATHNNNSTKAFQGVIAKFGLVDDDGKAIATATEETKVEHEKKEYGKEDMDTKAEGEIVTKKIFADQHRVSKKEDQESGKNEPFTQEEAPGVKQEHEPFGHVFHKPQMETGEELHTKMGDVPVTIKNEVPATATKEQIPVNAAVGTVNWYAVHKAADPELMEAIKCGGLSETKTKNIKAILRNVWEEMVLQTGSTVVAAQSEEYNTLQFLAALDYLRTETDMESVRAKLQSYPGIGLKTAMCVMCMCLGHDAFAVDTHVFRMSKFLGWLPPKASVVTACFHLDLRIPNELKYSLHNLLIRHGRSCKHCKGGPAAKQDDEEGEGTSPKNIRKPKVRKEKVETDAAGNPVKVKRTKKVWTGNGLMKQTLIEVDTSDDEAAEDDVCCLEDLVIRIREPRKEKTNRKDIKAVVDAGEGDVAGSQPTEGGGHDDQGKIPTVPAEGMGLDV